MKQTSKRIKLLFAAAMIVGITANIAGTIYADATAAKPTTIGAAR